MVAQPTDKNDPLYKLVAANLAFGDRKRIAEELGMAPETVSLVIKGRGKSPKIWNKLVATAMKNKKAKDEAIEYFSK